MPRDNNKPKKQKAQILWLLEQITELQKNNFYGKVTITLEEGLIQRTQKEESLKPPTG